MRRWLPLLIVVASVLAILAIPALQVAKWVGHKTLQVEVRVIDTNALESVAGAEVTIFDGPQSPIEGPVHGRRQTDFEPAPDASRTETQVTDSNGVARFTYVFPAAGSDGLWDNSGYVDTSQVWLRIRASGRPPALVSLDRQSTRARDIHDETPIVATVVLNKSAAD